MTIPSNGNAATTDGGALRVIDSGPLVSLPNGSQVFIKFNNSTELVEYNVLVMGGSWVAIGYGATMTDTDMVLWSADGASSYQTDLYSTGE